MTPIQDLAPGEYGWYVDMGMGSTGQSTVGQPLDLFPGRVIVKGSEEEKAYLAQLKAEANPEQQAEFAALERVSKLAEKKDQAE